jgi:hypothetical protein
MGSGYEVAKLDRSQECQVWHSRAAEVHGCLSQQRITAHHGYGSVLNGDRVPKSVANPGFRSCQSRMGVPPKLHAYSLIQACLPCRTVHYICFFHMT